MSVVFNIARTNVYIQEIRQMIPCDNKAYVVPLNIASRYADKLFILPQSFVDNIDNEKRRLAENDAILNKRIEEYRTELKILEMERKGYFFDRDDLRKEKSNFFSFIVNNLKQSNCPRRDFLYSFCFNNDVDDAIKRLKRSINSIINQNVRVCVCNTSKNCIWNKIKNIGNISYKHVPCNWEEYNKSFTINLGVKELVKSDYFYISDIDLIYPETFIDEMNKFTMFWKPVRVIFHNYNLGTDFYSDKFMDYEKEFNRSKDVGRQSFGIAPGNGLIHLESFMKIRGFDEGFIGYGPEDAEFNFRIKYINEYIELNNPKVNTYHLHHKMSFNNNTNHRINFLRFRTSQVNIQTAMFGRILNKDLIEVLQSNKGKNWGVI